MNAASSTQVLLSLVVIIIYFVITWTKLDKMQRDLDQIRKDITEVKKKLGVEK